MIACKFLEKRNLVQKINPERSSISQIKQEIKHSLISIIVFGFSIMPIIYLIRLGMIELLPNTWKNIIIGLIILTLWNEIHFYLVHRLMHHRILMSHVHYIHHKSRTPTIYSVFSFHWFEALLLSTVPLCILPFVPMAPAAIGIFPLISILLNFAGHCNYRFGKGLSKSWLSFGTNHNEHHSVGNHKFGFATPLLDYLFTNHSKKT